MRTLLTVLGLLLLFPFAALAAQDGDEAPTKDEIAEEFLDVVKKELGKQTEASARATVDRLLEIWKDAEVSEDVKKVVPDYLEEIADSKVEAACVAGIEGLAAVGGDDAAKSLVKILQKAIKEKEPPVQVYSASLKALGEIASHDKGVVKELKDLLKYKDFDVVGKAAQALAGYKDAPGKLRKDLLEEVIKQSEGTFNSSNNNDANAMRKWNIIRGGIMTALNALSGQSFADPSQARAWFNDHKKDRDLWN